MVGSRFLPYHHAPTQHNDEEFFGVEYLYRQAGRQFSILEDSTPADSPVDDELIDEVDEGFVDNSTGAPFISEHLLTVDHDAEAPYHEEDDCEDNVEIEDEDEASAIYNTWTAFM